MNLRQAMAITPCRWGYYGFEGVELKLKPFVVQELITAFSTPSSLSTSEEMAIKNLRQVKSFISDETLEVLFSNRLDALKCLVEYFVTLEGNLKREITDLSDDVIDFLKTQKLLENQELSIVWEQGCFDGALKFKVVEDTDTDGNVLLKSFLNDKFVSSFPETYVPYELVKLRLISQLFEMFQRQFQTFSGEFLQYYSDQTEAFYDDFCTCEGETEELRIQIHELEMQVDELTSDDEKIDSDSSLL